MPVHPHVVSARLAKVVTRSFACYSLLGNQHGSNSSAVFIRLSAHPFGRISL